MRRLALRLLAAALGLYLALSLSRTALGILEETGRGRELRAALDRTEAEAAALERQAAMTDEALRLWAFRREGLVSPEDVVFFDAGPVRRRDER